MKRATDDELMEKLRQQQKRLAERLAKLQAKKRAADRKAETRQKVLLGAFIRAWMDKDPEMEKRVLAGLERYLKRDVDRMVFGFELRGDGDTRGGQAKPPAANCDEQAAVAGA
jgi:hypothetical protein